MSRTIVHTIVRPSVDDEAGDKQVIAFRRFHQLGRQVFGSDWDAIRPAITVVVSRGRETSSKALGRNELVTASAMMAIMGELGEQE